MKKFYTSNYARNNSHPNAVAISAGPPSYYKGKVASMLAPSWELLNLFKDGRINQEQYKKYYIDLLKQRGLTPELIVSKFDHETIFLCYESPNDFCHRHILADWIKQNTTTDVQELLTSLKQQRLVDDLLDID